MALDSTGTRCLWLEFSGEAAGDCGQSEPFSFIRLTDNRIEGGERREPIASLRGGWWILADDDCTRIARISGLGVFSVHMEQMDGSDASVECTETHIDGVDLLVDGRAVARYDESRNAWTRVGTASRLHGIRLEPAGDFDSVRRRPGPRTE